MADYGTVQIKVNTGTDGTPNFTSTPIAFGGSAGANEFRWQRTGGGGVGSTASASWPNIIKPVSTAAVEEMYAFSGDTAGSKIATYDGGRTFARVLYFDFDAAGSPASAMQFSAFQDTANTTPTRGSQTANATDGRNIINGINPDTGASAPTATSFFKINAYGSGCPAAGSQETPAAGNVGTTLAVTSGTDGSVSPGAAAWLATWQSALGWIQYITAPSTAKVTTAFQWYISCALYVGPNISTGAMSFACFVLQYTWS